MSEKERKREEDGKKRINKRSEERFRVKRRKEKTQEKSVVDPFPRDRGGGCPIAVSGISEL